MVLPLRNSNNNTNKKPHVGFEQGDENNNPVTTTFPRTPHPKKKQRAEATNDSEAQPRTPHPNKGIHMPKENDVPPKDDDMSSLLYPQQNHEEESVVMGGNDDDVPQEENQVAEETAHDDDEQEPNWMELEQQEPARTDVPMFLDARQRREATNKRFGVALDECHEALNLSTRALLDVAVEYYQQSQESMDAMESDITQHLIHNHETRNAMHQRLQETAEQTQGLFAQLLMRVSQPFMASGANKNNNKDETEQRE